MIAITLRKHRITHRNTGICQGAIGGFRAADRIPWTLFPKHRGTGRRRWRPSLTHAGCVQKRDLVSPSLQIAENKHRTSFGEN